MSAKFLHFVSTISTGYIHISLTICGNASGTFKSFELNAQSPLALSIEYCVASLQVFSHKQFLPGYQPQCAKVSLPQ